MRIGNAVERVIVAGLLLLQLAVATVGLFWVAWLSDWHWLLRVPAGIVNFIFIHMLVKLAWMRLQVWQIMRQG